MGAGNASISCTSLLLPVSVTTTSSARQTRTQMRVMMLIMNHLEPFRKLKAFGTFYDLLKQFGTFWNYLEPFRKLKAFGTF